MRAQLARRWPSFAEEEGSEKARVFRRGYDQQIADKQIVVVEDILTTGGSARKVIAAVQALGGTVVGLSVLCNRGGITATDVGDIPIHALTTVTLDSWDEAECPMCQQGVPINTSVGKGQAFLARQR